MNNNKNVNYKRSLLLKAFYVIFFINFCILIGTISSKGIQTTKSYIPEKGYVPDEITAIKIAEAVWLPIYGEKIYEKKPFVAGLSDNGIWIIKGTLPPSKLGGVPYAEIKKLDGKIMKVYHTK